MLLSLSFYLSTSFVSLSLSSSSGFDLEDPYYQFAIPVVEMQIAKGGIRMANVLNSVFAQASMKRFTGSRAEFQASEDKEMAGDIIEVAQE